MDRPIVAGYCLWQWADLNNRDRGTLDLQSNKFSVPDPSNVRYRITAEDQGQLWRRIASGRSWPNAGAQFDEINATLLTFQGISEGPVWRMHFGMLADSNVSGTDGGG